jgi:hypothetical protein
VRSDVDVTSPSRNAPAVDVGLRNCLAEPTQPLRILSGPALKREAFERVTVGECAPVTPR